MNIITNHKELINHHLPVIMGTYPSMAVGLVGAPGTGKTYLMTNQVRTLWAAENNVQTHQVGILTYRTADREAAEFAGLMMPSKNADGELETVSIKPDLIRKIEELRAQGFNYIVVLLDELLQSLPDVQKVLSSFLDRSENTLGGHDCGEGLFVCYTGNKQSDKSGARPALGHLRNRVVQFELQGYTSDTVAAWEEDFASKNGILPAIIECAKQHVDNGFFADTVPLDGQYNTFRGLTNVNSLIMTFLERSDTTKLSASDAKKLSTPIVKLVAAVIGESAASIIEDYFDCEGEVPTAEDILNNPESAMVPDQTGYQHLAGGLALRIATDERSADAAIKYITRLRADLQVQLGVRLLGKSRKMGVVLLRATARDFIRSPAALIQLSKEIEV